MQPYGNKRSKNPPPSYHAIRPTATGYARDGCGRRRSAELVGAGGDGPREAEEIARDGAASADKVAGRVRWPTSYAGPLSRWENSINHSPGLTAINLVRLATKSGKG